MAESSSGSSGNWWDSWIQAAKDKSSQAYDLIKADLSEFRNACTNDASSILANTAQRLQDTMQSGGENSGAENIKKGISTFLGKITQVLTIPPDEEDNDEVLRITPSGNFEVFDKAKARLYEIQTSPQTYCTDPDGPSEKFATWKEAFDLESRKGEISELLISVNEVRGIYTKLVPSAVSHADFWERYFYKVHQLEQDEKRKAELKQRADKLNVENSVSTKSWDDDWEAEDMATTESSTLVARPSSPSHSITAHSGHSSVSFSLTAKEETEMCDSSMEAPAVFNTPLPEMHVSHTEDAVAEINMSDSTTSKEEHQEGCVYESKMVEDRFTQQEKLEADAEKCDEIPTKERKDFVMIGSDRPTPTSSVGSNTKDSSGLDDDWDKELFGDDLKAVQDLVNKLTEEGQGKDQATRTDEDWEDW